MDTIWPHHADRAFRHAVFVTGRREDAEDVVQTVFVRLAGLGADLLVRSTLGRDAEHSRVLDPELLAEQRDLTAQVLVLGATPGQAYRPRT